jgi:hypothetical protein
MLDRALGRDPEQGGAPLRLPSGDFSKPDPNRRPHTQARFKVFRQPVLEKIHRTPAHQIAGRAGSAGTIADYIADYIVDYIADYTLRHLLAFASRKRCFSRVSRDEKVADRA